MTLKYTAKTVAVGSGMPEKVPEIVRYSRVEREDYPFPAGILELKKRALSLPLSKDNIIVCASPYPASLLQ